MFLLSREIHFWKMSTNSIHLKKKCAHFFILFLLSFSDCSQSLLRFKHFPWQHLIFTMDALYISISTRTDTTLSTIGRRPNQSPPTINHHFLLLPLPWTMFMNLLQNKVGADCFLITKPPYSSLCVESSSHAPQNHRPFNLLFPTYFIVLSVCIYILQYSILFPSQSL